MAKCVVPHCKPGSDRELFCAPDDKNKLRKWKQILKVQDDEFFVCDLHFEAKYIQHEKLLTPNAYPSVLLSSNESTDEICCCCCLERFTEQTIRRKVDDKIKEIFKQHVGFELPSTSICFQCNEKLLMYERFTSEIKAKHANLQKQQPATATEKKAVEEDGDSDVEIIEVPIEVIEVAEDSQPSSQELSPRKRPRKEEIVCRKPFTSPSKSTAPLAQSSQSKEKLEKEEATSTTNEALSPIASSSGSSETESVRKAVQYQSKTPALLERQTSSQDSNGVSSPRKASVKCPKCHLMLPNNALFHEHFASEHSKKAAFKFTCQVCEFRSQNEDEMVKHIESSHITLYDCEICPDKKFKTRVAYKCHMFLHHKTWIDETPPKGSTEKTPKGSSKKPSNESPKKQPKKRKYVRKTNGADKPAKRKAYELIEVENEN